MQWERERERSVRVGGSDGERKFEGGSEEMLADFEVSKEEGDTPEF